MVTTGPLNIIYKARSGFVLDLRRRRRRSRIFVRPGRPLERVSRIQSSSWDEKPATQAGSVRPGSMLESRTGSTDTKSRKCLPSDENGLKTRLNTSREKKKPKPVFDGQIVGSSWDHLGASGQVKIRPGTWQIDGFRFVLEPLAGNLPGSGLTYYIQGSCYNSL